MAVKSRGGREVNRLATDGSVHEALEIASVNLSPSWNAARRWGVSDSLTWSLRNVSARSSTTSGASLLSRTRRGSPRISPGDADTV